MKSYYVYILASSGNTTIYIGVTNDLVRRSSEHSLKENDGFTKKYNCNKLVYFEETLNANDAVAREKQLKRWRREKKNWLIESVNPTWKDLLA